jgi:hypothetical protein
MSNAKIPAGAEALRRTSTLEWASSGRQRQFKSKFKVNYTISPTSFIFILVLT